MRTEAPLWLYHYRGQACRDPLVRMPWPNLPIAQIGAWLVMQPRLTRVSRTYDQTTSRRTPPIVYSRVPVVITMLCL